MRKIRIFDLKFNNQYRKEFFKGAKKILDEGFLSNHTFVKELESQLSKYNKIQNCILSTSATTSLELILKAINIKNKVVLVSTNTFIATASAIINSGGKPKPVDIDDDFTGMCPITLENQLKNNYKKIGAVVIVHIGGLISPKIKKIVKICKKFNVPLVEDCAQSFGSKYDNKMSGSFGIAGALSFQTTKVYTTGEGGCVVTKSKELAKKIRSLRQFGVDFKNPLLHTMNGNNYKVSEFVALAGICELKRVKRRINKRIMIAKRYQKLLKNSSWKTLIPGVNSSTSYYKQIVISPIKREVLIKTCSNNGISITGGVYYVPLHKQPILKKYILGKDIFNNSNFFSKNHFCPPCYPEMKIKDVDYICKFLLGLKK